MRIGNGAFDQRQNDVFGAVLDSVLLHTSRSRRLPRRLWPLVQSQAAGAIAAWREPDQGIWEARGKPQHYVSSKLMGWVALDRAAKLAAIRDDDGLAEQWRATADEIREDILAHGVSERGVLRQHYDTDALDASTLLAALFGFLPGTDERLRNTVDAIEQELTENGFVLRYRTDETDDGLSGKEGTFLICSYWLVSALAVVGEMDRATEPDGAPAADRLAPRPVRGGVRGRAGPASRQLPAGVLPPGAARRRRADHHRRLPNRGVAVTEDSHPRPTSSSSAAGWPASPAAHRLGDEGVAVTLVDRNDYQQFQPLLYQVATSQLPAEDIARPHRTIFRDHPTVEVRTGEVTGIDPSGLSLTLSTGETVSGSHLVIAAGAKPEFFGVPGAADHAFPLYSVSDAERLRRHLQRLLRDRPRVATRTSCTSSSWVAGRPAWRPRGRSAS